MLSESESEQNPSKQSTAANAQNIDLDPVGVQTAKARHSKAFDLTVEDEDDEDTTIKSPSKRDIEQRKKKIED